MSLFGSKICVSWFKLHAFHNKTGIANVCVLPKKSLIHKSSNQIKFPARWVFVKSHRVHIGAKVWRI